MVGHSAVEQLEAEAGRLEIEGHPPLLSKPQVRTKDSSQAQTDNPDIHTSTAQPCCSVHLPIHQLDLWAVSFRYVS